MLKLIPPPEDCMVHTAVQLTAKRADQLPNSQSKYFISLFTEMHIQHFILKSSLIVSFKSLSLPLSVLPSDKVMQNKKENLFIPSTERRKGGMKGQEKKNKVEDLSKSKHLRQSNINNINPSAVPLSVLL